MKNQKLVKIAVVVLAVATLVLSAAFLVKQINSQKTRGVVFAEKNISIPVGGDYALSAKVLPETATDTSYQFSTDYIHILDVSGHIVHGKTAGTAVVTVSQNGKAYDQCLVTVYDVLPTEIHFSSEQVLGRVGDTVELSTYLLPANASVTDVEYTVADGNIARVANGRLELLSVGTTTVTAKQPQSGVCAGLPVTVLPIELQAISVNIASALSLGTTVSLQATMTPANPTNVHLEWTSSDPQIIAVVDGTLTALKPGTATVTVTDTFSKVSAFATVKVVAIDVASLSIADSCTLSVGGEQILTAEILPANASDKQLVWQSSDPDVVAVTDGKLVAYKVGKATVTATASNGKKATCVVTVEPKEVKIINGLVVKPADECVAPVKINAPGDASVYVFFKNTVDSRNDFSLLVKAGTSCEVDAPLGTYTIYYASGKVWYGKENAFGSGTKYYVCDGTTRLYADTQYYHGTELTLYGVADGNLETDEISGSDFPD